MLLNVADLRRSILAFARESENIRAVIETGAFARHFPSADELSDLDIELYAREPQILRESNAWFENFGTIWVFLALENDGYNPTRLVIYEGGAKVDFALYDAERLAQKQPSAAQQRGFKIHLDKDEALRNWRALPLEIARRPSLKTWQKCRADFWFESFNWAKYLARGDLWHAKIREAEVKTYLLQMLEWHAAMRGCDAFYLGHFMREWTDETTWREIETIWARFHARDNFRALEAMLDLFARVSSEVAVQWDLPVQGIDEAGIRGFIAALRNKG